MSESAWEARRGQPTWDTGSPGGRRAPGIPVLEETAQTLSSSDLPWTTQVPVAVSGGAGMCTFRASAAAGQVQAVLNQGDQGENLIPPSLILVPDVPDVPEVPWVLSGA